MLCAVLFRANPLCTKRQNEQAVEDAGLSLNFATLWQTAGAKHDDSVLKVAVWGCLRDYYLSPK